MNVIITFGCRHKIKDKVFDHDCVARIKCKDKSSGREKAFLDKNISSYYLRGIIDLEEEEE